MGAATGVEPARNGARVPWGDVVMSAVAAVSWALIGMAGTAALGLRLLEADAAGSSGPMTAAVVALAAGGSVTPSGDVSAFGLSGAQADTAIEITPLGVSLVGAVLLSWFFLRSLRAAGVVVSPAELAARAGAIVALFVAMLGGLAWAGHDVITIDGGSLGLDDVPGGGGGVEVPGLGDIGGLLPDRLGELVDAQAAVGFTVDTAPTLLGGLGWSAGILLIALLASRRTPLPPGWDAVHRVVRPAVSALVTVLLVAVAAGLAAAAYAAVGDEHPRRIAGAALLGAPNGVWLGVPLGLFVPWDGRATGALIRFLPDPLDDLLGAGTGRPVTLGRLAELDGRVWLLAVAAGLMMLLAGVLTAVRTPVVPDAPGRPGALAFAGRCALRLGAATALALPLLAWLTDVSVTASLSILGFDAFGAAIALHGDLGMALLLGAVWGAGAGGAGALLAWACGVPGRSAAVRAQGGAGRGAGVSGGVYGAGAGLTAGPTAGPGAGGPGWAYDGGAGGGDGDAGGGRKDGGDASVRGVARIGEGGSPGGGGSAGQVGAGGGTVRPGYDGNAGWPGPQPGRTGPPGVFPSPSGHAEGPGASGPHTVDEARGRARPGAATTPPGDGRSAGASGPEVAGEGAGRAGTASSGYGTGEAGSRGAHRGEQASPGEESGPYTPGVPYRPPNPDTNPYLRVPDGLREPEDARPGDARPSGARPSGARPSGAPPSDGSDTPGDGDIYGAPTVVRPVGPPPRGPRQSPGPGNGNGPPARPDDGPPPPPPPPPPPRKPRGGR
ncbi:streptophobe family protein [Streptomyces sp. DT190]|uniref:streptophobe family protein n=1 Tax=unclassified Streptomyces TaxID=2593676 RepID=UPI003CF7F7D3